MHTICGVRQIQDVNTKDIIRAQQEYTKTMRLRTNDEIVTARSDISVGRRLHSLFRSLLGAHAYTLLTRHDIFGFVAVLISTTAGQNKRQKQRNESITEIIA